MKHKINQSIEKREPTIKKTKSNGFAMYANDNVDEKNIIEQRMNEIHNLIKTANKEAQEYFDRIKNKATTNGITKDDYLCFMQNYFYRTDVNTIFSIVIMLAHSVGNKNLGDSLTFFCNLQDELGDGKYENAHSKLFADTITLHSKKIYELDSQAIEEDTYLLESVKSFVFQQKSIYENCTDIWFKKSNDKAKILKAKGWICAHEALATNMLRNIKECFFTPCEKNYKDNAKLYEQVMKYFDVHLDGTEDKHGKQMMQMITRCIGEKKDYELVKQGVEEFIACQNAIWQELAEKICNNKEKTTSSTTASINIVYLDEVRAATPSSSSSKEKEEKNIKLDI